MKGAHLFCVAGTRFGGRLASSTSSSRGGARGRAGLHHNIGGVLPHFLVSQLPEVHPLEGLLILTLIITQPGATKKHVTY